MIMQLLSLRIEELPEYELVPEITFLQRESQHGKSSSAEQEGEGAKLGSGAAAISL